MNNEYNILLVEDEQVVATAASRILGSEGFQVDRAETAEIAFEKLNHNQYHLILSDLMLPKMSGIELMAEVRKLDATIPIIIITGYASLKNAVKSFKTGAFDFIPKPFDFEELAGVVYRAVNHIEMTKESDQTQIPHGSKDAEIKKEKYYFLGQHSWAKMDKDGVFRIGVGGTFAGRIGTINSIEQPSINDQISRGNLCVRIISKEYFNHVVWAPISGKVVAINQQVESNSDLINSAPLSDGWLIKVVPTNLEKELENLVILQK